MEPSDIRANAKAPQAGSFDERPPGWESRPLRGGIRPPSFKPSRQGHHLTGNETPHAPTMLRRLRGGVRGVRRAGRIFLLRICAVRRGAVRNTRGHCVRARLCRSAANDARARRSDRPHGGRRGQARGFRDCRAHAHHGRRWVCCAHLTPGLADRRVRSAGIEDLKARPRNRVATALIEEGRRMPLWIIGHRRTRTGLDRPLAMGRSRRLHADASVYTVYSHSDFS